MSEKISNKKPIFFLLQNNLLNTVSELALSTTSIAIEFDTLEADYFQIFFFLRLV